jgi:phosphoglycerate dehydrogenase-like enzyme
MAVKIYSSLPLGLLEEEMLKAGISGDRWCFVKDDTDLSTMEVFFGSFFRQTNLPKRKAILKELKWIQLDSVDITGYAACSGNLSDVVITNTKGVFSRVIAESVIGSILAVYRGLCASQKAQLNKSWESSPIRRRLDQLHGKKVLILGGGSIATELVRLLVNGFQCETTVFRRKNEPLAGARLINTLHELTSILGSVDILIDALPATSKTENFVSGEILRQVSRHSLFVNVGRGATVDEEVLIGMLREGRISGAILDVVKREPPAKNSAVWDTPNLYFTQHIAGGHRDELLWRCQFFAENLKRYLENKPLLNQIHNDQCQDLYRSEKEA